MPNVRKAYKVRWEGWSIVKSSGGVSTSYHARRLSESVRLAVHQDGKDWHWGVYDMRPGRGSKTGGLKIKAGVTLTWAMARHAAERYGEIYDEGGTK